MAVRNATRHLSYPAPKGWPVSDDGLDKLRQSELQEKRNRVRLFLTRQKLDGLWLTQPANLLWYSGWGWHAPSQSQFPSLLILRDQAYCLTDTAAGESAPKSCDPGLEALLYDSSKPDALWKLLELLTSDLLIGCDTIYPPFQAVESEMNMLRLGMTPTEQHRYRLLCQDCTTALETVARTLEPGQTEKDIAAEIASKCYAMGIRPTVLLVSADSGLRGSRHPSPGDQIIHRFAILVLEGTRGGLQAGLTRTVAVDQLPLALEQRYYAAARLHAQSVDLVRPGLVLGDVLRGGLSLYESSAHPADWHARLHGFIHDYERQTAAATLHSYQAFTLITGINGIQSHETFFLLPDTSSVWTASANWPVLEFETASGTIYRPDILRL